MADSNAHGHGMPDEDRRDLLFLATGAVGAVGVSAAVWPLVDQMNPSASVLALSSIEVDISSLERGQQITVQFLGSPVFIRRMTEAEIAEANAVELSELKDTDARNENNPGAPATLADRLIDPSREFLVQSGVCTHLGCVPVGDAGDYHGWYCPCHGSHYDTAGRIRLGPAPENLWIPVAKFVDDNTIKLG